jgi:hypothetical protein
MIKVVDGVEVVLSAEEEAEVRARWAADAPLALERARTGALAAVDAAAEAARLRYITPGAGQALSYLRKEEEARRFVALSQNDQAAATVGQFPMLAAALGADGDTIAAVAGVVLNRAAAWGLIGAEIERRRLAAKRAIGAAADEAAIAAAGVVDFAGGLP